MTGGGTPWSSITLGRTDGEYVDSTFSDFRIYSTPLSSTQVSDLYYSGLMSRQETGQTVVMDRFDESKGENPLSTYHMDEGYGTTVNRLVA